jgi:hypothetical protein
MKSRLRFLTPGQRFEYKRTIFEKVSAGIAKVIYVSSVYAKDQIVRLPPNTWISYRVPVTPKQIGQLRLF